MSETSLKITDIGTGGDGIARLENGETVFVPFSVAGDIVMADVVKDHDGQYRGKINSILLKSPDRAAPPCRHFGICGGCSLQHLNDNAYRALKRGVVLSALEKSGIVFPEKIEEIFIPDHTRRRANFAATIAKGKAVIGFHERKSANVRNVPDCLLINENVRNAMEAFRAFVPAIAGDGKKMDILIQCVEGQTEIALTGKIQDTLAAKEALADAMRTVDLSRISLRSRDYEPYETILDSKPFLKTFGSLNINLAPGSFLQPSDEGEAALTKLVMNGVGDASCIADLFCGNGTFTGPLIEGHDILAVDSAGNAISSLIRAGVKAQARDLFKNPMSAQELQDRDCVILDPPRAGAKAQCDILAQTNIPKIVYVSCSPQSFAKDAAILMAGGYMLRDLSIVDQFIWSTHTELVGVFTRD